jgi:hypothetical protein
MRRWGRRGRGRGHERGMRPAREQDGAQGGEVHESGPAGVLLGDDGDDAEAAGRRPGGVDEAVLDLEHMLYLRRKIGRSLAAAAAGKVQAQAGVKRRMATRRPRSIGRETGPRRRG